MGADITSYRDILTKVRAGFPSPVADRTQDGYFVRSVTQAVEKADALKSEHPVLSGYTSLNYDEALRTVVLNETGMSVEEVTSELVSYCRGLTVPGHPRTHHNVVAPPTIPALIGVLISSLRNPNLSWDEYSHRVALAEVEVTAMTSRLLGYDPVNSGGLFTFGGAGTTLYGIKIGLEKAVPGAIRDGVTGQVAVVGSAASHYCRYNVAGWLGIGAKNTITVPVDASNAMRLDILREKLWDALRKKVRIAGIIATMGTTDAFGIDNLAGIVAIRDELVAEFKLPYRIHVHADAVIGWAWSVFNSYDFELNPAGFQPTTVRMLQEAQRDICHLHLADSVGVDFHKVGFTPYISSLVLFKNRTDLTRMLSRPQEQMPYLYQFGSYRPGMYSIESSRAGGGVLAALANLRLFGKQGFQAIIGHLVEMTQLMRNHLEEQDIVVILNRDNVGPVTVFRVYPRTEDVTAVLGEREER